MSHTISLPVVRFSLAGLLSLLMTFFLFFFMQNLVKNTGTVYVEKTDPTPKFDFVRLQRDETVRPKEIVKPPPIVEDQPALPEPESFIDPTVDQTLISYNDIDTRVPGDRIDPSTIAISDGDILPVLKVQPNYPRSAIVNGIEGYVIVEFTVTTTGATRDIKIVSAEPANIFNQSAIRAAEKFKYKPRIIDGEAVEVPGVQNKFTYEITE